MSDITTWRRQITMEMKEYGDSWENVEAWAGADSFDLEFDCGYGGKRGQPFTVWTKDRVYFPHAYDGAETCLSVSRNPDGKATEHIE